MAQRPRTAAAVNRSAAASLVESTAPYAAELLRGSDPGWGEIPGRLFGLDLDHGIERYQPVRNCDLLSNLDTLIRQRIALQIGHRHPTVDPPDPEPMKDVRHQLLKAHVLHAGDALGAAEISVGAVAPCLALAGVVDKEFGDFPERPPFLAVVDDEPDPTLLRGLDADLDPVHEIGAAGADIRAEHV